MAEIRVPKTPRKAFNKNRRPSGLLLKQVEHLQWASLPASKRKPQQLKNLRKRRPRTEAAAANEIARLTALVREQAATPYVPPDPAAKPARSRARRRVNRKK